MIVDFSRLVTIEPGVAYREADATLLIDPSMMAVSIPFIDPKNDEFPYRCMGAAIARARQKRPELRFRRVLNLWCTPSAAKAVEVA